MAKSKLKRKYTPPVLKQLFGLSGNQCAHPDCLLNIIEPKTEYSDTAVVGQICHIYAISEDGPRGKPGLTEEELNSIDNLILCCGHHHPVIDKQHETYPTELLIQWKDVHESKINRLVSDGSKPVHMDVFRNQVFREDLVDGEIEKQVGVLRKSRFFPEFEKVPISLSLGRELIDRGLSGGTDSVRCRALSWCARILAVSDEVKVSNEYLDVAKALGVCEEIDIAEAFICSKTGGKKDALKVLGKHITPQARSASFMIVATHEKLGGALEWLKVADIKATDLDADGKHVLLSRLLTEGLWDEAKEIAENHITADDFNQNSALYRYVAMTYLVHAIPEDFRMLILGQIPFGASEFPLDDNANGMKLRNKSIDLFREAGITERQLNCPCVASFDEDFVLWLELRDRDKREEAKIRLEKALENVETGLRLVTLALDFGIEVDENVIDKEVERQFALNGEYSFDAAIARFSLAFVQKTEKQVVAYLEKYEKKLTGFIEQKIIQKLKAEMLAKSGQYEKAWLCHKKLEAEGASEVELSRVQRIIEDAEGGDTSKNLIDQFNLSCDIQDLILLVKDLECEGDLSELVHYSKLLFDKTHAFSDAARLVLAYFNNLEYTKVITFLSSNETYLDRSGNLRLLLALSFFELGQLSEALKELNRLPTDYEHPNIESLRINIAIASGDWNSLTISLASGFERKDQKSAMELISLAKLAFELNSPYARDFLFLAAEKGADDAQVLTNAYGIATESGIEDSEEITGWLNKAAALSSDTGPIQTMTLAELLVEKPQWDERSGDIWDKLAKGQVPMFMAGEYLNKSLVELMLFPAVTNMSESDPRRRAVIPAYSGKRSVIELVEMKVIGIDATAMLTLGFLGILKKVIEVFDKIYIPHSTMMWLFQENGKASFHQPSRIKNAHQIRNLISKGSLEKLEPHVATNSDLSAMVGEELAQLLSEAQAGKDEDGRQKIVVRSSPVHHLGSLKNNEADLSEHSGFLSSCQEVIDKLAQIGQITDDDRLTSEGYLNIREKPWPYQPEILENAVLYLDGLSVTYLFHLGMLEKLSLAGFKVVISKKEVEEGNNLISFEQASGRVQDVIEDIRLNLSLGLKNGNIVLNERICVDKGDQIAGQDHPSIEAISLANSCEGVVIDDRFLNCHPNIDGGIKTAKVITTLDLLGILSSKYALSVEEIRRLNSKLRQASYFLFPFDSDELMSLIKSASVRNCSVIENPALRAVRENLLRVRMCDWLTLPEEGKWIENVFRTLNTTLKKVWEDESEIETILARSDWLLELLDLRGWAHCLVGNAGNQVGNTGRLPYILIIISAPPDLTSGVKDEFWNWIEAKIIIPIKEEYPELYESIVCSQKNYFDQIKNLEVDDELKSKKNPMLARALFEATMGLLPPTVRDSILADKSFCEKYNIKTKSVLNIGGSGLSMDSDLFVGGIKKALSDNQPFKISDALDRKLILERVESGNMKLSSKEHEVSALLPDFYQFSPNKEFRISGFERELSETYLPPLQANKWKNILVKRALHSEEFDVFNSDFQNSPVKMGVQIRNNVLNNKGAVSDLVPQSKNYYENLIGVFDGSDSIQNFAINVVKPHFEELINWNLGEGISYALLTSSHSVIPALIDINRYKQSKIIQLFEYLDKSGDVISLIGGVEIGVRVMETHPEIEPYLIKLIEKLRDDDLECASKGIRLFSTLVVLVDGELSRLKLFFDKPPFYRRLASFTHAALIHRQLVSLNVEVEKFEKWVYKNQGMNFYTQSFADMRVEPRWSPDMLENTQVKFDLLGRIMIAAGPHKNKFTEMEIHSVLFGDNPKSVLSNTHFMKSYMPGPLEGAEGTSPDIPKDFTKVIDEQLSSEESGPEKFIALLNSAPIFKIDPKYAALTADSLKEMQYHLNNVADKKQLVTILSRLATLAAVTRSASLADEIKVLLRAYRQNHNYKLSIDEYLLIGLEAAASRKELSEWALYVGALFQYLAFSDIDRDEAEGIRYYMQCMFRSEPVLWRTCAKADAAIQAFLGIKK